MSPDTAQFEWILNGKPKLRDGEYGEVFQGLRVDNGQLLWAEKLDVGGPPLQRAISALQNLPRLDHQLAIKYLGHQQKDGHVYLLTESMQGGTLREWIQSAREPIPTSFARKVLLDLIDGLEELYKHGYATVLLDSDQIWLDGTGFRINRPLLDCSIVGRPLRSPAFTVPEILFGHRDLSKADVWLLGIVAVQLFSMETTFDAEYPSAITLGTKIREHQGVTAEDVFPGTLPAEPMALDFLKQCLTIQSDNRPLVSQLRCHPFILGHSREHS